MSARRLGKVAVGVAAAIAIVLGGAALANAATGTLSSSGNSSTNSTGGPGGGYGNRGGSSDTAVTGAEATKVGDAVKAKDSAVTVTSVRKDPDGSFDVFGTKSGSPVMFDVSADLRTITQNSHAGPGGGGGRGGSSDTAVTGAEATKVGDAVKAKDSAVTVTSVRKDPDGSFDVFGTKSGSSVMFEVSADLKTITQNTNAGHGPGGPGGSGGQAGGGHDSAPSGSVPGSSSAPSSSATTQS